MRARRGARDQSRGAPRSCNGGRQERVRAWAAKPLLSAAQSARQPLRISSIRSEKSPNLPLCLTKYESNRRAADSPFAAEKMTVSGALARDQGRPYVAERRELLQVCSIPPRFCKLCAGFVPVAALTTLGGGKVTSDKGAGEIRRFVGAPFPASFRCPG